MVRDLHFSGRRNGSAAHHQAIHASTPAWSPDGQQIAFTRNEDVGEFTTFSDDDVFVMDADGGNVRRLTRGDADVDPAWSPDGTEIAFGHCFGIESPTFCTLDLFVMDVATGASRQLTRTPLCYEAGYAWSPDSARIAFTR